jgi:hypothetical protein
MALPKEVVLTREGGNFYRAMAFHFATVAIVLPPSMVVMLLCLINPFWFRDSAFNWFERKVRQVTRWRDLVKYRIYLGTDPEVWHALKDPVGK